MKNIFFLLLFIFSVSSFSQHKKDIVFIFDEKNKYSHIERDNVYVLNDLAFRFDREKHKKRKIEYDSIKEKIISTKKFKERAKNKKIPEFYGHYNFYLFFKENTKYGWLLEVEKIWLVEDKIVD